VRILLIAPPVDYARSYRPRLSRRLLFDSGFGAVPGLTPPMGLLYIAAAVRAAGHEAFFCDCSLRGIDGAVADARRLTPDLVGFTCTAFDWPTVRDLAGRVKEVAPGARTIAGGPFPEAVPEQCLRECAALDFVGRGDGELLVPELLEALGGHRRLDQVRGLCRREADAVACHPRVPFAADLDAFPQPAWDLVDVTRYVPSIGYFRRLPNATIVGSRGCPHRCTYCHTTTREGNRVRYRSAASVLAEIDYLVTRRGVRDLVFWDNNITGSERFTTELCEGLLARPYRLTWAGATRADRVRPATLRLMRRAGCWRLLVGVESGVQRNLDAVNKRERLEDVAAKIRLCQECGLEVYATFIFGLPGETYADGLATIRWAIEHDVDYARFFTLGVHPGTPLHAEASRHGTLLGEQWAQDQAHVGFVPHTMTKEDIEELVDRAHRDFYARPGYILKRLHRIRSREDALANLRGFAALVL
jgi:radical SAM superfamily enzyme YgiQ (UPF0313 family)